MSTLREKMMAGAIVTLAMILAGDVTVNNLSQSYYCPSRDIVSECMRFSSTNITCYNFLGNGTRCTEGWKPLSNYLKTPEQLNQVKVNANNKNYNCILTNNVVTSFTKCSSGESETYLGELI